MGNKSKRYDEDFKRQCVKHMSESNKSVSQIAKDLGISDHSLHKWKGIYGNEPGVTGLTPAQEENIRLKKELADAVMERDILKKAVAIFSTPRK
jgi:transposase